MYTYHMKRKQGQRGITLIELIVVIFIFAVVSSVLLFNYSSFSTNITVKNLAQEIALSIRKAQTLATSVRGASPGSPFERDLLGNPIGYGITFSLGGGGGGFQILPQAGLGRKGFIIFKDLNGDGFYTNTFRGGSGGCGTPTIDGSGNINECFEKFEIKTGDSLSKICIDGTCPDPKEVTIFFRRPNPDAIIYYNKSNPQRKSSARIEVESAKGLKQTIQVWNTGQISVLP